MWRQFSTRTAKLTHNSWKSIHNTYENVGCQFNRQTIRSFSFSHRPLTNTQLWMRDETKYKEGRCIFTPDTAQALINNGYDVTVERSEVRCFPDSDYELLGCNMVEPGTWRNAPKDTYICGLKELPENDDSPLIHKHIFFCHVYKYQQGWQSMMKRFHKGGGKLYDLEFLTDDEGERVAAFSFHAGLTGCAAALLRWGKYTSEKSESMAPIKQYSSREALIDEVTVALNAAKNVGKKDPKVLIIGATGRCGRGASEFIEEIQKTGTNVEVVKWDRTLGNKSSHSGPYWDILSFDVLINCIYLKGPTGIFVSRDMLDVPYPERRLCVIGDVSCDTSSPHNPLPFCNKTTTFDEPTMRVAYPILKQQPLPLDVIAIDHLPTMLPRESSSVYSKALLPSLIDIKKNTGVWTRAEDLFQQKLEEALQE